MPVTCPVSFSRLSTEEFGSLDYEVMKHAFESHKDLGRLTDECVYQADFAARLKAAGFEVLREVPVTVSFEGFEKIYYLDLVVSGLAIYELKTARQLSQEHVGQVMNYLFLVNCNRGKLINFRSESVESRFVNIPVSQEERRAFVVDDKRWNGPADFYRHSIELLRDLGTSLEIALYGQAMIHFLGGNESVTRGLPMQRGNIGLGNQRFHMIDDNAAFKITAFKGCAQGYENQLNKLLKYSPLMTIHWINIGLREVTYISVGK